MPGSAFGVSPQPLSHLWVGRPGLVRYIMSVDPARSATAKSSSAVSTLRLGIRYDKPYYWNASTGASQWELPEAHAWMNRALHRQLMVPTKVVFVMGVLVGIGAAQATAISVPDGWEAVYSKAGCAETAAAMQVTSCP